MQGSVRKHRDKWQARFKSKDIGTGQWRQVSKVFSTRRDAELWLRRTTAEYGEMATDAGSMTVAELVDEWYTQKSRRWSPSTRQHHRYVVASIVDYFGDTPITKIKVRDIDRWITSLERDGLSVRTIGRRYDILRQAFKLAVRYDYIVKNPTDNVSLPEQVRTRVTPPSPTEVVALQRAAHDLSPEFGLLVTLAVVTGMRRGELLALRWSDIDLRAGTIVVERALAFDEGNVVVEKGTKTGNRRVIDVGEVTVAALKAFKAEQAKQALVLGVRRSDGRVFTHEPGSDEPWRPDYVTMTFSRIRTHLGLSTRFHDLRHFCATRLLTSGVDLATVAARLGHSDGGKTTISIYAHAMPHRSREAADIMERDVIGRRTAG